MSVNPYKLTRISVTGKESQTPGMPRVNARSNAIGTIKIKLRNRERICPYTVNCVEEKVIDVIEQFPDWLRLVSVHFVVN